MVTIVDNDQGFQFGSSRFTVTQDAGVIRIAVLRGTDDTNGTVSVDVSTSDITATNGVDYVGSTNTLLFAPGEKMKPAALHLLNNGLRGPSKTFQIRLSNPGGGAVLGTPASAPITILNSALGVGFESATYSNAWGSSNIIVTVVRGNMAALGPITVDYATTNLTATAGVDYEAVLGTLQFQQNETVKHIAIPILRTRTVTGAKSFRLTLSNPTGGAVLGSASATASIDGAYVTIAPAFDTSLTIAFENGINIIGWSGGGELQRADGPAGPWQRMTNAAAPFAVQSPLPTTFYRVSRPRPVDVYVPSSYSGQKPMPLLILLHGYTGSGADQESYMHIGPLAESRGFLYCHPDGTTDRWGNPFWNATDACCNFGNTDIDDAGYLRAVIEEIADRLSVDRKRIYLIGHSNGSFMAYRMACQNADLIAGIAGLAGETFLDSSRCTPSGPVNILHIQGTADDTIPYGGGATTVANGFPANLPAFPAALETIQAWAVYNGATAPMTDSAPTLDLTTDVPGPDTVVTRYTNAQPGGAVELWTINGGSHGPTLSAQFSPLVVDWLLAHPKP
jgi:polyhydroxybutyrate depolymerase